MCKHFSKKISKKFFVILLRGENMTVKIVCLYIEGDENNLIYLVLLTSIL